MEKERYDEYKESLDEASIYPEEINSMEFRLMKRIHHKKRKTLISGITSTAAVFLLFILIVNSQTAMADAIFDMPVIGSLAKYVCFDKGLQNAVNNEYTKKLDLTQQDNGYILGIPYVIADSKRLVLFFQIPENVTTQDNASIHVTINKIVDSATGRKYEGYTSQYFSYSKEEQKEYNGLSYTSIRSVDLPIPQDLKIYVSMSKESFSPEKAAENSQSSELFEPSTDTDIEKLGDYVFDLHLNDYPEPKVINLNKDLEVKGQTIQINSVTEYPTGTEIRVSIPDNNNCIINGLNMKAIDTAGDEWDNPSGVISSGPNEDNEIIYYLESNYFSQAALNKIQINGIRLIKKSEAEITLDLQKKTMKPEPSDIRIKSIEKAGNKAYITFETDTSECFGIFKHEYSDTKGNKYEFNSESASPLDTKTETHFAVVWPVDDKVILTRSMSPMIKLKKPVEIDVNE